MPVRIITRALCVLSPLMYLMLAAHACDVDRVLTELTEDAKQLKIEISATNYPAMFVQNAKLQRQLIKVEKTIEKIVATRTTSIAKVCITICTDLACARML